MIWMIGIGGLLGAVARYLLGISVNKNKKDTPFPLGTWIINISGSFILGILVHLHLLNLLSERLWFLLGVGFCGAYTTFSTFGYETITLLQNKKHMLAFIYVITSVILGVLLATFGYYLAG